MSRVVVVGSANLDLVVTAPHIPRAGETVLGADLVRRAGGKGGNQAVAAHRLGADTVLVAAIGDDQIAGELRSELVREGLDLSHLAVVPGVSTGVALIVVDEAGENSIVVAPGANHALGRTMMAALPGLLGPSDILSLQIEIPLATSLEAASRARDLGATVVFNAAPLPDDPDQTLMKLLGTVDVVVLNEGEALQLTGRTPPNDVAGWAELAEDVRRLGPDIAVVTLGARGAVAATGERVHTQPAFAVDVADTTGAGDGFVGALAVALGEGRPIADALRRACAAGALATTRLGAQEALPRAHELERFLADADEVVGHAS